MKLLETEFKKNDFDYKQLWRDEDYAIYEQSFQGNVIAYEVFKIKKNKEWTIGGKTIPESESIPGTNEWGTNAYTKYSIEKCHSLVVRMKQESLQSKKLTVGTQSPIEPQIQNTQDES